jgi:hypothetical protein
MPTHTHAHAPDVDLQHACQPQRVRLALLLQQHHQRFTQQCCWQLRCALALCSAACCHSLFITAAAASRLFLRCCCCCLLWLLQPLQPLGVSRQQLLALHHRRLKPRLPPRLRRAVAASCHALQQPHKVAHAALAEACCSACCRSIMPAATRLQAQAGCCCCERAQHIRGRHTQVWLHGGQQRRQLLRLRVRAGVPACCGELGMCFASRVRVVPACNSVVGATGTPCCLHAAPHLESPSSVLATCPANAAEVAAPPPPAAAAAAAVPAPACFCFCCRCG